MCNNIIINRYLFCMYKRGIFEIVTQEENFSIGEMYKGNTSIVVGLTVRRGPFISPENTNAVTFNNGLFYSKGQAGIFPEENPEKGDDLLSSPDELSARKVEGGIFIEVLVKSGKFTTVECGKNDFSNSPVARGGIHRISSPHV